MIGGGWVAMKYDVMAHDQNYSAQHMLYKSLDCWLEIDLTDLSMHSKISLINAGLVLL